MKKKVLGLLLSIGMIFSGGQNVMAAEIDKFACMTYKHLYGDDAYHDLTSDEFKALLITSSEIEDIKNS